VDINALIIISCICMLFVIGRIFIVPLKWILKLAFNSVIGGVLIWIINLIGGAWGFHIGLNFYTSLLVRFFRHSWRGCFNINEINCWIKELRLHNYYGAWVGWLKLNSITLANQVNSVHCKIGEFHHIDFTIFRKNAGQNAFNNFAGIFETFTVQFFDTDV